MRAFGKTLVISEIKEEVKNKLGLIITEANDRDIRYKLGEVEMVGEEVLKIEKGDRLYYDKINASEIRLEGKKYFIINLSDVRVVI